MLINRFRLWTKKANEGKRMKYYLIAIIIIFIVIISSLVVFGFNKLWNKSEPTTPDHDFEIAFDVEINSEENILILTPLREQIDWNEYIVTVNNVEVKTSTKISQTGDNSTFSSSDWDPEYGEEYEVVISKENDIEWKDKLYPNI